MRYGAAVSAIPVAGIIIIIIIIYQHPHSAPRRSHTTVHVLYDNDKNTNNYDTTLLLHVIFLALFYRSSSDGQAVGIIAVAQPATNNSR